MSDSMSPIRDSDGFAARVRSVINNCIQQRAAGQAITDEMLISAHPHLLPELGEELRKLQLIAADREHDGIRGDSTVTRSHHQSNTSSGSGQLEVRCPSCHVPMK